MEPGAIPAVVGVAQLAEHLVVVQDVGGSSPLTHPRVETEEALVIAMMARASLCLARDSRSQMSDSGSDLGVDLVRCRRRPPGSRTRREGFTGSHERRRNSRAQNTCQADRQGWASGQVRPAAG